MPLFNSMFNLDEMYKLMLEYLLIVVLTVFGLQITLLFVRTLLELQ
jgi:hypothetical protein